MKYIKKFNESIHSQNNIKQDIMDIFQELEDIGYEIDVNFRYKTDFYSFNKVTIKIKHKSRTIFMFQIQEELRRLCDYLDESKFYFQSSRITSIYSSPDIFRNIEALLNFNREIAIVELTFYSPH